VPAADASWHMYWKTERLDSLGLAQKDIEQKKVAFFKVLYNDNRFRSYFSWENCSHVWHVLQKHAVTKDDATGEMKVKKMTRASLRNIVQLRFGLILGFVSVSSFRVEFDPDLCSVLGCSSGKFLFGVGLVS
jgi:hypothetical protein